METQSTQSTQSTLQRIVDRVREILNESFVPITVLLGINEYKQLIQADPEFVFKISSGKEYVQGLEILKVQTDNYFYVTVEFYRNNT